MLDKLLEENFKVNLSKNDMIALNDVHKEMIKLRKENYEKYIKEKYKV